VLVVGVFIAQPPKWSLGRLLSKGAPHSPVRQPCHPTVRVRPLELLTYGPSDSPMVHWIGPVHCPVNYSGVASQIPEGGKFGVNLPGAPDTVRCARPGQPSVVFCSFYLNPFLDFVLVCCESLAPVELII
jgi:hypothetical protein